MNIYKRLIKHLYNKAFPNAEPKTDPTKPMQIVFKTIEPECINSKIIIFDYEKEQVERLYKDDEEILYSDFVKSRLLDAMRDKIKENIKVEEVIGYLPGAKEYIGTLKVIPFDVILSEVKT